MEKKSIKQTVLELVSENGCLLKNLPEFQDDRDIVLAAVRQSGLALLYASDDLKKDKDIVLAAASQNVGALAYASWGLRKDRDFMLAAVKKDCRALRFASEELSKDPEFVLEAVKKNSYVLQFLSEELRKDPDIVLAAVKQDGCALEDASDELRKDPDIVLAAMKNNILAFKYSLLDKGVIKELYQKIPAKEYISKEAHKMSLFDTTSKKDNSMIEQNEETLSKILSYFSITDASRLSQVSKETNSSIEFNF